MKFLALLSSVPFESELILSQMKNVRKTKVAGKAIYKGKLSNIKVLLMNTGIGKVNAAHSATGIIEHFPIRCIINLGVGGVYPKSGLEISNVAIASKEIYGDEGVITSKGWTGIKEIGIPLVQIGKKKYFNEFFLDKKLVKKTLNSVKRITTRLNSSTLSDSTELAEVSLPKGSPKSHHASRITIKPGSFVTVSATTDTHKRAIELKRRFNAICENMEGAAIAHICTIYKIPMLEIRGISNIVGNRDRSKWDLKVASENCQKAVLKIIRYI